MSNAPSISASLVSLLRSGTNSLQKAANEFNAASFSDPVVETSDPNLPSASVQDLDSQASSLVPQDVQNSDNPYMATSSSVQDSESSSPASDPLIAGVSDMLMAKLQTGAAGLLMKADTSHRQQILDLLKPP